MIPWGPFAWWGKQFLIPFSHLVNAVSIICHHFTPYYNFTPQIFDYIRNYHNPSKVYVIPIWHFQTHHQSTHFNIFTSILPQISLHVDKTSNSLQSTLCLRIIQNKNRGGTRGCQATSAPHQFNVDFARVLTYELPIALNWLWRWQNELFKDVTYPHKEKCVTHASWDNFYTESRKSAEKSTPYLNKNKAETIKFLHSFLFRFVGKIRRLDII